MSTSKSSGDVSKIKVLVPISNGTEEIEAVTIIDTLVRAGAEVTTAIVGEHTSLTATCSRGVKIVGDKFIEDCIHENWNMIACPGGMPGATHLRDSKALTSLLQSQYAANKYIAAICASPAVVLSHHNLIKGRKATCYPVPKFTAMIPGCSNSAVEIDGTLITSQGPGTSLMFALSLVEVLFGKEKAEALHKEMIA
mmetsp:Transcript_15058/g.20679  ORF Transcript_15058/g.20679 Transcript_15058/m.20679 type:complete len:196 (-) Transcript_15058:168-755(-)